MFLYSVGVYVWALLSFSCPLSFSQSERRLKKEELFLATLSLRKWRGGRKKVGEEEEDGEEGGGCMGELALLPCERSSIVPGTFQSLP